MLKPSLALSDTAALHLGYLDFYRSVIEKKLEGLTEAELRHSRLPSGWSPLELLKHLVYMERRWFHWGVAARQVDEPWGDSGGDSEGPWQVGPDDTLAELLAELHSVGATTRTILSGMELTDFGKVGGRFTAEQRPTVNWVCFHVLQEYARHAGQLDIVRELADGETGED